MKLVALATGCLLVGACSTRASSLAHTSAAPAASSDLVCSSSEEASSQVESAPAPVEKEQALAHNEALEHLAIGKTRSSPPKKGEWQGGNAVDLARDDTRCAGRLVREWLRIRCFIPRVTGVSLLGGTSDGTSMRLVGTFDERSAASAEIVFPLRSGDRRVFQITSLTEGDDWGGGESISAMISESWVDEDRGPVVLVGP
jgi:hypothetical protein